MDQVSEIGFLQPEINVRNGLNIAFLHFLTIFDDFSKFCNAFGTLHFEKIIKYVWQKFGKNEEKPFFHPQNVRNSNPGIRIPHPIRH